jgi:hypothetical protein
MFRPENAEGRLVSRGGLRSRQTTMGVTASPRPLQLPGADHEIMARETADRMEDAEISAR